MNLMKLLLLIIFGIFIEGCNSLTTETNKIFEGFWLEETTPNQPYIQGFELKPDGTASSIGTATLQYENWTVKNNKLILSGKSIGNRQTIKFSNEWQVIEINSSTLKIKQPEGFTINYSRVKAIPNSDKGLSRKIND